MMSNEWFDAKQGEGKKGQNGVDETDKGTAVSSRHGRASFSPPPSDDETSPG